VIAFTESKSCPSFSFLEKDVRDVSLAASIPYKPEGSSTRQQGRLSSCCGTISLRLHPFSPASGCRESTMQTHGLCTRQGHRVACVWQHILALWPAVVHAIVVVLSFRTKRTLRDLRSRLSGSITRSHFWRTSTLEKSSKPPHHTKAMNSCFAASIEIFAF